MSFTSIYNSLLFFVNNSAISDEITYSMYKDYELMPKLNTSGSYVGLTQTEVCGAGYVFVSAGTKLRALCQQLWMN